MKKEKEAGGGGGEEGEGGNVLITLCGSAASRNQEMSRFPLPPSLPAVLDLFELKSHAEILPAGWQFKLLRRDGFDHSILRIFFTHAWPTKFLNLSFLIFASAHSMDLDTDPNKVFLGADFLPTIENVSKFLAVKFERRVCVIRKFLIPRPVGQFSLPSNLKRIRMSRRHT